MPPCEGTASTPFQAFQEKEGASSSQTNHYQSINFQQPYQKYSFEELRLADYAQGRRYGNASGQAGAFGANTGFGGFGTQSSTPAAGGFGGNAFGTTGTATSSPFGGTTSTATSGFGGTTGGSLFGKPATTGGGLFGGTQSSGTTSGGLFGTAGTTNTGGGFGGTNTGGFGGTNTTQTGTNAFGGGNNQQKPGGLFGAGGFGTTSTNTTGGGLFGTTNPTNTTGGFGGGQTNTGGGGFSGFGATQQQNQQTQGKSLFGGFGGTGGQTATQPATGGGLFGGNAGANDSTGFGGQQQQQQQQQGQTGGLFGNPGQQQNTGGGLFGGGNNQQKPGGLFGGTNTTQTGGGLFGGPTPAQNTGGNSLFSGLGGNNNQQQQQQQDNKPGGLFGGTNNSGGGGLFGTLGGNNGNANQNSNTGGGLFGTLGNNQQQQQQGGSLFSNSANANGSSLFNSQQAQSQPNSLQASLMDANPYGSQSIFSGLPAPSVNSPGPLATPLSASLKAKSRSPLPMYKITPNAANRLISPNNRRTGYGFSYSTYGSPSTAPNSLNSTPTSLGSSLLGSSLRGSSSFNKGLVKSMSTSSLRRPWDSESDPILSPGAFSASSSRYANGGNLKKLAIDRSLRSDLFSKPTPLPITNGEENQANASVKLKKKVSFDSGTVGGGEPSAANALVPIQSESPEPSAEEMGFFRSSRNGTGHTNGTNGVSTPTPSKTSKAPEMEQVRGNELAVVPENSELAQKRPIGADGDPEPGRYWSRPSVEELRAMSREELKHVVDFTVGREACGEVKFNGVVDLTPFDFENGFFGSIVEIHVRSITVYPDERTKPPRGKGLNVPSTLIIMNSWPRSDQKKPIVDAPGIVLQRHIRRLKKVPDTEYITYDIKSGEWHFKVPHFTTYGLDYDDDEDEDTQNLGESVLSAPPDTPTPKSRTPARTSAEPVDDSMMSVDEESSSELEDDTFDFKRRKDVPGAFSRGETILEYEDDEESPDESFLGESSTGSTSEYDGTEVSEENTTEEATDGTEEAESVADYDMNMAGSYPALDQTVEQKTPTKAPAKTLGNVAPALGTPGRITFDLDGDWADHLQRTISPRKQDREALRQMQEKVLIDVGNESPAAMHKRSVVNKEDGIKNSIDLMNSLFGQHEERRASPKKAGAKTRGFQWPYAKGPKTFAGDGSEMSPEEEQFHNSFKPKFGPSGTFICAKTEEDDENEDDDEVFQESFAIETLGKDIVVSQFIRHEDDSSTLRIQRSAAEIRLVDGVPFAMLKRNTFQQFQESLAGAKDTQTKAERDAWELATILFTDYVDDIDEKMSPSMRKKHHYRIKKDRVSRFVKTHATQNLTFDINAVSSLEERAFHFLSINNVAAATRCLLDNKDYHLATLVAQLDKRDRATMEIMAEQVQQWKDQNVWSEMSEPIRALYEILAGNCCVSEGKPVGAVEDRSSTFSLSERYSLSWMRAFGLRLWYGIAADEPLGEAVGLFSQELAKGSELARPLPWFADQLNEEYREEMWQDRHLDPLWVLLQAEQTMLKRDSGPQLQRKVTAAISWPVCVDPLAISAKMQHRVSFQMLQSFAALQHELPTRVTMQKDPFASEKLITAYAEELEVTGRIEWAAWVLLHLAKAPLREHALKELLLRSGDHLDAAHDLLASSNNVSEAAVSSLWTTLVDEFQIPEQWLYISLAYRARYLGRKAREVKFLLLAKHYSEAHDVFCHNVAPALIVRQKYNTLARLLSMFGEEETAAKRVRGWENGGAIFDDFVVLVGAMKKSGREHYRGILTRLMARLADWEGRLNSSKGLEEKVAFREMGKMVAEWCAQDQVCFLSSFHITTFCWT